MMSSMGRAMSLHKTPHIEQFEPRRLLSDGVLDRSFGANGVATADFGAPIEMRAWKLLDNGKMLAVGVGPNKQIAAARFNANGSLDTSFDGDGKKLIPLNLPANRT